MYTENKIKTFFFWCHGLSDVTDDPLLSPLHSFILEPAVTEVIQSQTAPPCCDAFRWMRLTNSCFSRQPRHSSPHEAKMFLSSNTLSFCSDSLLRSFSRGSVCRKHNTNLSDIQTSGRCCCCCCYRIWADRSECLCCWAADRSSPRGRGRPAVWTRRLWPVLLRHCWLPGSSTKTPECTVSFSVVYTWLSEH